jgi:predicted amidohydrolase YtcJ
VLFRTIVVLLLLSISAVAQATADLILVNANIYTMEADAPRARALAVKDGRLIFVGNDRGAKRTAGPSTIVLDALGRTVIPGFNDAHVHFSAIGNRFSHLDLRQASSLRDVQARLGEYTSIVPKGRWIIGTLAGSELMYSLQRERIIDSAGSDHPVLLFMHNERLALANAAALKNARITTETTDPPNGRIERITGSSTVILHGAAVDAVRSAVPADHGSNWTEIAQMASNYAAKRGVTSVQDVHSDDLYDAYRSLAQRGLLKTRIYECIGLDAWQKLARSNVKAAEGDATVRRGCVKGVSHGEAYEMAELTRLISAADKAALQVMVHAIGREANQIVLMAFEAAALRNGTRDRRFRTEHAARLNPRDLPRLARNGIIASMQPVLFETDGMKLGDDYRALLDSGVFLALGSDAPIADLDPLWGIYAAVNAGGGRSLTIHQAVRAYTLGSAHAEFQDREKGSLSTGKLADFVILSDDIFSIAASEIREVKVLTTVVAGRIVYSQE